MLPPRLAPQHVVILPIYRNDEEGGPVLEYCRKLRGELSTQTYDNGPVRAVVDTRHPRADKKWQRVKRGVPTYRGGRPPRYSGRHADAQARDESTAEKNPAISRAAVRRPASAHSWQQCRQTFTTGAWLSPRRTRGRSRTCAEFESYFTRKSADKPEIHGGFAIASHRRRAGVGRGAAQAQADGPLHSARRRTRLRRANRTGKCLVQRQPTKVRAVISGVLRGPALNRSTVTGARHFSAAIAGAFDPGGVQPTWGGVDWARATQAESGLGAGGCCERAVLLRCDDYYEPSMGPGISKCFFAFERLIDPAQFVELKLQTNAWEADYAGRGRARGRRAPESRSWLSDAGQAGAGVDEDPPIGCTCRGIYAEVTLYYKHRQWQERDWTFPDYRCADYQQFFSRCREYLRTRASQGTGGTRAAASWRWRSCRD